MIKKIKKILFYYRGLPNSDVPMEGTSRSLLNWADYVSVAGIAEVVDVCGDYIKREELGSTAIRYLKIPAKGEEEAFLSQYDVVFFFTFRGIFSDCKKAEGQIWILEQQCFEVSSFEFGRTDDFDFCVAHSQAQKYQMIRQGVKIETIFVITNICDFDKEDTGFIHPRDENSIMFVGAIVPHKGLDILIKALPEIRRKRSNIILHVYGSSSMWKADGNEYENEIRSQKIDNVVYHGAVPSDVIIKEYQKYSVMCLPTALECFPHVSIEAQNGGCIPVIHDAGGSYATMDINKTGFVYKPNTPKMVAKAIDKAFTTVSENSEMRVNAQKFALNNFSQEVVGKEMDKFFYHIQNNKKFLTQGLFDAENYLKSAVLSESILHAVAKKEIKKITIIEAMRSHSLKNKNTLNIYEAFSLAKRLYESGAIEISNLWFNKITNLKNIDSKIKMQSYFFLADINNGNIKKTNTLNKKGIDALKNSKYKTISDLYRIASLYKEKGFLGKAYKSFSKLLNNKIDNRLKGGIYFHLGEIDFLQDKQSSALKSFKQCLEYIPNHGKALNYLEKIS